MSESETKGRCRKQIEGAYAHNRNCVPSYAWITADAIDRLAADVAAIKAKVDAVSPEDVRHFVEAEKAWVALVTEQRDAAIRERDEARAEVVKAMKQRGIAVMQRDAAITRRDDAEAEVERLKAELAARPPDGNSSKTSNSSPSAPQPAAPPAGWLTERERMAVAYFAQVCRDDLVPDEWTDSAGVLRSLLARAGSPPVVEVPAMRLHGQRRPDSMTIREVQLAQAYRDALDKAGVKWKEVPRE